MLVSDESAKCRHQDSVAAIVDADMKLCKCVVRTKI